MMYFVYNRSISTLSLNVTFRRTHIVHTSTKTDWKEAIQMTHSLRSTLMLGILFFLGLAYFFEPTVFEYRSDYLGVTILFGAITVGVWAAKTKIKSQDFSILPLEIKNKSEIALCQIVVAMSVLQVATVASLLLVIVPIQVTMTTLLSTASLFSYSFTLFMLMLSLFLIRMEWSILKKYLNT